MTLLFTDLLRVGVQMFMWWKTKNIRIIRLTASRKIYREKKLYKSKIRQSHHKILHSSTLFYEAQKYKNKHKKLSLEIFIRMIRYR